MVSLPTPAHAIREQREAECEMPCPARAAPSSWAPGPAGREVGERAGVCDGVAVCRDPRRHAGVPLPRVDTYTRA